MTPTVMGDIPKTAHAAPEITIYGPHDCPNCDKAMKLFDRNTILYNKIDIEPGDEKHRYVTEKLGYMQAPVIIVTLDTGRIIHWGGHRMDMLMALTRLCTTGLTETKES